MDLPQEYFISTNNKQPLNERTADAVRGSLTKRRRREITLLPNFSIVDPNMLDPMPMITPRPFNGLQGCRVVLLQALKH